jgi:hypothetical protein
MATLIGYIIVGRLESDREKRGTADRNGQHQQ